MSDITANVVVSMPSQLFTMPRSFKAVANGKIYISKIDTPPGEMTDPANSVQVYLENEDGSHVPVSQPLIINAGGFPVYNGQIAKFVTVEGHAMSVYDAYNAQQFYYPNVLKYDPDQLRTDLNTEGTPTLVDDSRILVIQPVSGARERTQHEHNLSTISIDDFEDVDITGVNPSDNGIKKALEYSAEFGKTIDFIGKIRITRTVKQPPNSSIDCRNGVIFCEDPSGLENGVMWSVEDPGIVNEKTTRIGTLILSTSPVIGEGVIVDRDVMGLSITTPKVVVDNIYTYGCRLGGVKTGPNGYEITLKMVTCFINSWTDKSKWGIDLSAADGINGSLVCVGYARGIRSSGTNHIDFMHPWGFPATSGNEYQNRQLLTALSLASNTHVNHCYLDSVDTDGYNTPQSGDDGVNIVFEGFNTTIAKCFILVHAQTKPGKVKIASYKGAQNTIENLMVNNDTQLDTTNPVIYSTAIKKWQNHVLGGNVLYLTNRFAYSAQSLINGGVFTGTITFRKFGATEIEVSCKISCTNASISDATFSIKLPDGVELDNSVGTLIKRTMLTGLANTQSMVIVENSKIIPSYLTDVSGEYIYYDKASVKTGDLNFTIKAFNVTSLY
ncbi:phage tailspike protein [Citrobacter portucalensis]|uniref:phage tailspike protein n=1 Tax=Citrobacter portucalensis TaxID=1639133 RepID=UPI00301DB755